MIFKKLQLPTMSFSRKANKQKIKELIDEFKRLSENYAEKGPYPEIKTYSGTLPKKRQDDCLLFDTIYAMGLCHSVMPVKEGSQKQFQAASPDEIAIVKQTESLNLELEERKLDEIVLKNPLGKLEVFKILQEFPFSCERKRMGIILQHQNTQKIVFYLKGAEDVMMEKVAQNVKWQIQEDCEMLASKGLRTLVFTQKLLTQQEYEDFRLKYNQAEMSMIDRENRMQQVVQDLENNMNYLAITGVEDKLQNNVRDTISNLKCAGIKI